MEEEYRNITVKLIDNDRFNLLMETLKGFPEDEQTPFDLSLLSIIVAKCMGLELDDLYRGMEAQEPIADQFVSKLAELNEYEGYLK